MKYGTMLLAGALLVGLVGCGSPPPEEPSSAAMGGPSEAPVPAGAGSSRILVVTPPLADRPLRPSLTTEPRPDARKEPAPRPEHLILPDWIAKALEAPEVPVQLQALDCCAQQGTQATLDPLVVALDDENEEVGTKAMAIIERHWAVEREGEEVRGEQ